METTKSVLCAPHRVACKDPKRQWMQSVFITWKHTGPTVGRHFIIIVSLTSKSNFIGKLRLGKIKIKDSPKAIKGQGRI